MREHLGRWMDWWLKQNFWHYLWVPVAVSIAMTELIVVGMNLLLLGHVDDGYLLTGLVAAALVSAVVCAALFFLSDHVRKQEERYHLLVDDAEIPVLLVSLSNGEVVFANGKAAEQLGCRIEDIIGLRAGDFWANPEQRRRYDEEIAQHGRVSGHEAEFRTRSGGTIWVSLSANVTDFGGVPTLFTLFSDITERKRIERQLQREHAFRQKILDSIPGAFYLFDSSGRFLMWNHNLEAVLGLTAEEVRCSQPLDFFDQQDKPRIETAIRQVFEAGESAVEALLVTKDGRRIPYYFNGYRFELDDQPALIGIGLDITDRKRAEEALREDEEKLRGLFDLSPLGIALTDMAGRYVEFNDAFQRICGYPADELKTLDYWTLTPKKYEAQEAAQLDSLARTGCYGPYEKEYQRKDGSLVPLRLNGMLVTGADGQRYIWSIVEDVTERKKIEQQLVQFAQTDELTQLANRRHFMAIAEQELSRTIRYGGSLSVLMMDIDQFKSINDTYGHRTGDAGLKRLGELCREDLRDIDAVGRLGGEEFAVLLPQTGGEQALEVAERLRKTIALAEIPLEHGLPLHLTVSIGVATLAGRNTNIDTLLSQADKALYEAKHRGRNRVCAYTSHDHEKA